MILSFVPGNVSHESLIAISTVHWLMTGQWNCGTMLDFFLSIPQNTSSNCDHTAVRNRITDAKGIRVDWPTYAV